MLLQPRPSDLAAVCTAAAQRSGSILDRADQCLGLASRHFLRPYELSKNTTSPLDLDGAVRHGVPATFVEHIEAEHVFVRRE